MDHDKMLLTYHDCTLYQSDFDILTSEREWLNDNIISFWFEYLTNDEFCDCRDSIAFMDPSMMFMVAHSEEVEDLKECLQPLDLDHKQLIMMPINDHRSIRTVGGSHWCELLISLLCSVLLLSLL